MSDIGSANRLDEDRFVAAFGHLFENSPWIAQRAWKARPFADDDAMHAAMIAVARGATEDEKLTLLRAHPELAGTAARAGDMTSDSVSEQGGAGLDRLTEDVFRRFDRLNEAYRGKFGFPFIIAVRGRGKTEILDAFEARLAHDRPTEIDTAIDQIAIISRMRLDRLRSARGRA